MLHNWQTLITFALVAWAAWYVGRRLWGQILAFRARPPRRHPSVSKPAAPPRPETLVQIQLKPPVHLKRPPPDA